MFKFLAKQFERLRIYEVTLILKSGRTIRYRTKSWTIKESYDNHLTSISNQGSSGFPHYLRLDDVSVITTRRVFR